MYRYISEREGRKVGRRGRREGGEGGEAAELCERREAKRGEESMEANVVPKKLCQREAKRV